MGISSGKGILFVAKVENKKYPKRPTFTSIDLKYAALSFIDNDDVVATDS